MGSKSQATSSQQSIANGESGKRHHKIPQARGFEGNAAAEKYHDNSRDQKNPAKTSGLSWKHN